MGSRCRIVYLRISFKISLKMIFYFRFKIKDQFSGEFSTDFVLSNYPFYHSSLTRLNNYSYFDKIKSFCGWWWMWCRLCHTVDLRCVQSFLVLFWRFLSLSPSFQFRSSFNKSHITFFLYFFLCATDD